MGKKRENCTYHSQMVVGIFVLLALTVSAGRVQAVSVLNSCTTYCHGAPPRDAARKGNPHFGSQSSAFLGNHRNHLPAAADFASCSICHTPVAATDYGHQNNVIGMANSLKKYSSASVRAKYDKGVFFNLTSVPNLTSATCSNVNCHFEKKTPAWGSAAYNVTTDCNACHGAPPAGTPAAPAGGLAGSHARHDAYFPGTANCQKCHPNSTSFIHATSAGRALKVTGFLRDPLNTLETTGTYSGTGLNYMPSKSASPAFGTCSTIYCHSSGQSTTGAGSGITITTTAWGSAALNCGSCHQNMGPAVNAGATGKHAKHSQTAAIACSVCHGAGYTSTTVPTGAGTIHVDKNINLAWTGMAATPLTVYSKTNNFLAGSAAYGSCSSNYCHSTVQNATTGLAGATYRTVSWASATTLTCAGCHVDLAADATGTGSHRIHTISTGANFDCAVCHAGYTKTTTTPATHANGLIELGATGFTYSQGSGSSNPAANGYGTCSTSTCHGSSTVTWGGTLWSTTDQCGKCHSSNTAGAITQTAPFYSTSYPTKVTLNTDAKVGAHTNHMTSQSLGISASTACTDCHGTVTLTAATHMNGSTTLTWSALATKTGVLSPTYTAATGQCAATYCHGNSMPGGDISGTNKAPTWINPNYLPATISAAACGTCHGFPPATASGHPGGITIPVGFPATATIGTTCSCHSNINSAGNSYATIFVNPSLHINGILETPLGGHSFPFSGSLHLSAAGSTPWSGCTSCHTNTAGGTYPVAAGTAPNCTACHLQGLKVPSGTSSCWDCHGTSAIDGKPSGNVFPNISGNHRIHVAISGTTCATCHTGGGNGIATHGSSNRVAATAATVKVAFTGQGVAPLWTLVNKTCSATYCHGQGTPAWGARTGALVNGFPYSSVQCAKCHSGNLAADVTSAKPFYSTAIPQVTVNTNAKVGAHTSHMTAPDGLANAFACADCHGTVTLAAATHMNGVTNFTWSTLASKSGALTPTYTAATGSCANVYCHGASMPGGDVSGSNKAPVWNSSTYLPATLTAAACGTCHGFPPAAASGHPAGITIPAGFPATATIGTSCSCHPNINTAGNSYANIFVNKTLHINGVVDASGGGASSGGSPCYGCHSIYNVMNSSTASFHHVLDDASPDQAPNTGTYPSSQTVLACTSCHTDHNYINTNKGANLRASYNAAAGATNNHDFSTTAPYGLCVSCHATAQTKGTAQTVAGTAATIAIDGSATGFQASMHNYTASSLFGTSQFSANCVKCHTDEQTKDKQTSAAPDKFGLHYSVQRSLLNPMGATPQAAAGADFCYRCHSKATDVNPGGGIAKTTSLKDYFGSKAMTAASEDIFSTMQLVNRHNVSSYKGLHKDDETRAGIAAAKHVECVDCHDPHLAKAGRHTAGTAALAGVLTGVSGVGVTTWGANWAGVAATAYNPSTTTAPLISATAEWQVCFKCHSGANANVATWGGAAATAAAFTDLALEFNPNNASHHPVVSALPAASQLTAARLTGGWVPGSVMTCSDCHATDSAASKGPHGSSVKWMLAGINKAWPYTTTAGNGTSTGTLYRIATYNTGAGTANGLFCLNCHTIRPATGVNSWHSNSNVTGGQHGANATIMACASCHLRVPHGGKISRLLQTTNAPARYRSNGSTATSSFAYWGSATVNIKGSAFSNANFKSSCSEHSGTGGEAW